MYSAHVIKVRVDEISISHVHINNRFFHCKLVLELCLRNGTKRLVPLKMSPIRGSSNFKQMGKYISDTSL